MALQVDGRLSILPSKFTFATRCCGVPPPLSVFVSFSGRIFRGRWSSPTTVGRNDRTMRKIGLGRNSTRASLEACDTNEDAAQCGHRGERLISFVRSPGLQTRRTKKLNESTTEFITARRRRNHSTFLGQSGSVEHRTRRR